MIDLAFHLTAEQKELAADLAENLRLYMESDKQCVLQMARQSERTGLVRYTSK